MKKTVLFTPNLLTYTTLALSVGFSATAYSASETKEVERIQVTGSHIKRTDMEGPSPVQSLSAADLAATGSTDLIGALQKLPVSGAGTFSTQGNSSDDTANGGSSVALRGLGASSTLVLINGRRVAVSPFAKDIETSFVDLNSIPMSSVKRVDILKDGASATYGSDAVAGVINIILRDDIDGFEVAAKTSTTADGGGDEQNLTLLWGSSSNTSKHNFSIDYYKRDAILNSQRSYTATADQRFRGGNNSLSSSGFPGSVEVTRAMLTDAQWAALPVSRIDPEGNPVRQTIFADVWGNDTCDESLIIGDICRYDYAPHSTLVPSTERISFNYNGSQEITDNIEGFAEFSAQHSSSFIEGAASPSFTELTMMGDNPNHPLFNDPSHFLHGVDISMRRRTVEIGNRQKDVDSEYYRAVLGARGSFSDWDWEVAYSAIRSSAVEKGVNGFPNIIRTQEAIDSGLWNPFEPSTNTEAALAYFETTTTRSGASTMQSIDGTISGELFELGDDMAAIAIGFEARNERIEDNPDAQFLRGEIFGTEATQANGERDNKAIFAELSLPVLETLELQLALRHENYSDFGSTTDPKVAFRWTPLDSLVVRGSWGTAFRAPSLVQLHLGRTDESPSVIDKERCRQTGAEADCEPTEYTAIVAGNPDLQPETSSNYNLGVIWQTTDNFSVGVDYWNYDQEDLIKKIGAQKLVDCCGSDQALVQRAPSQGGNLGRILVINDTFVNIGGRETDGFDLNLNYRLNTDNLGEFKFNYNLTYTLNFEEQSFESDKQGNTSIVAEDLNGEFQHPEFRWVAGVDWSNESWLANVGINYISGYNDLPDTNNDRFDIDSWTSIDTSVSYVGFDELTLTLGASNLTNEEPPQAPSDSFGVDSKTHSAIGRQAYFKLAYKF
ncbi:TonB-dependent receptor [Pseudoalteromonas porphyrae]|uniref:TonB-dependent receptor n=1 Tax=Pseudoalteromonas porphyrae TaxID=187330 RepID=A0A0N1ELN8_9GAMM|nr:MULTISPECIES: TonB-dependent receptor [Pseudoalteromonas]KPH63967.1 TonB-dependent receptor [Pseudoalteromonas porphyrae]KPH96282.1 TonB-dependent receptor [Pseudoalteromonas porphyrae]NNG42283.1 TonB-dependent receptor [Pseudoalteromonas sp. NEC-BIFX-2020_002]